jgi:hypothetical protein
MRFDAHFGEAEAGSSRLRFCYTAAPRRLHSRPFTNPIAIQRAARPTWMPEDRLQRSSCARWLAASVWA